MAPAKKNIWHKIKSILHLVVPRSFCFVAQNIEPSFCSTSTILFCAETVSQLMTLFGMLKRPTAL
jgi:hypothetical protein